MLADNMKVYNKINDLVMKCDSCGSTDHLTYQCGLIVYKPIPKKVNGLYILNKLKIALRL
jgi:hypothetical protein